jgi:biotin carboxyl carrier protein
MKRTIRFRFEGQDYSVEVERSGDRLSVSKGDEHYTVQLLPDEAQASAGAIVPAAPAASTPPPEPSRGKPALKAEGAASRAAGTLYAPMTGLVKEIKVTVGSDVKKGEVVLVMEAMKMDVEVSSPATGVVAEVPVKAGDTVESQQPLMIIH